MMEERYIATVDLGTGKLALCIAKVEGEDVQIIYYRERPSHGVRYGAIYNPVHASVPLKEAIAEAEEELGIKINQVVVGIPRYGVRQESAKASTDRAEPESCISQDEIDNIKSMALDSYPLDDDAREEMYGAVAQSFSTEDAMNFNEHEVVGMPSASLEGNFKVFVGPKKALRNIDITLKNAGVAEACKYFLPNATAGAVLTDEEMENGVALIEMGAGVTSVTIFQDRILRYFYAIPFGGKSITSDIKFECGFSEHLAENIKLAYGACMPEHLQSMSDKILQIVDEENGTDQQISVKFLSEIITARVKEIVDAILFKVQESGYADKLRGGIVLTGGCADLTNCANLIKQMSGYNVRIGFPIIHKFSSSGCPGTGETSAAASMGMLLLAIRDSHLNCGGGSGETAAPAPAPENVQEGAGAENAPIEEADVEDLRDTIFRPEDWEVRPRPEKPRRSKEKTHKDSSLFRWTKGITETISGAMNSLYKDMEDEQ